MVRQRRSWTADEKRKICREAMASGVSVSKVAHRHQVNANLVFKWLRDPRFAASAETASAEAPMFLPVEVVAAERVDDGSSAKARSGKIELSLSGGRRLRITGGFDPDAVVRLVRGIEGMAL